jgi:RNA polymerase sigma factor (sigma-70 family)
MEDSDAILIQKILDSNSDIEFSLLFDRHKKIMFSTLQKYYRQNSQDFCDIENSFYNILYDSVRSFDLNKGSKFSTWLSNQVRYACLNLKTSKYKKEVTISEDIFHLLENHSTADHKENHSEELILSLKDILSKIKNKKIKEVILNRYFSQEKIVSYNDIARNMGITSQTALNWHNKFITFVKKNIDN